MAGSPARTVAARVGVNRKTAVFYFLSLRQIIMLELEREVDEVFAGEIEVDESDFGGKLKGRRGRGAAGKSRYLVYLSRVGRFTPG